MKYLSFDIECADGGKATICSFGYVIADEQFNVIKKEDIIMNPEGRFCLTGREGRPDVKLAYSQARFERAPKFSYFYERIRALLENEEYFVIGHSVADDVAYLNKACKRYKLPAFTFSYFDTQRLYREVKGERKQISLQNALLTLGIERDVVYHRSDEDAYATLLVLEKLLAEKGITMDEYLKEPSICTGKTADFVWSWDIEPECARSVCKRSRERALRPEHIENTMMRGRKNHVLFRRYLEHGEAIGEANDKLRGKRVSVTINYETDHFKEMIYLAGLIKAAGGEYVVKGSTSDIFATCDEFNEDGSLRRCTREEHVREAIREGAAIEIVTLDALLALLGLTREELEEVPLLDIEYLTDYRYAEK